MDSSEDAVLCPVCYSVYNDPRSLPCGHSFCLSCISRVAETKQRFSCPSCRKDVRLDEKGVNGFPKNYSLANIIEGHKKMLSTLCSNHKMSPDMFCEGCNVMICSDCVLSLHSGHAVKTTKDVFTARKGRLTELLESSKQLQDQIREEMDKIRSSRQSFENAANLIKGKIDDRFRRWSDDLEKQRKTLQLYVDEKRKQNLELFNGRLESLDYAASYICQFQAEMETAKTKDTTSIVKLYGSMEDSHSTVTMISEEAMSISFNPPPDLKIYINAPWMEEAIQNIKLFEPAQKKTTSVSPGICFILEENESLKRVVEELQREIDKNQSAIEIAEVRGKEISNQLEDEKKKTYHLRDILYKEKRNQELRNAELSRYVEEMKPRSLDQFEHLKKFLEDKNEHKCA